jgi:hypothetical protein
MVMYVSGLTLSQGKIPKKSPTQQIKRTVCSHWSQCASYNPHGLPDLRTIHYISEHLLSLLISTKALLFFQGWTQSCSLDRCYTSYNDASSFDFSLNKRHGRCWRI